VVDLDILEATVEDMQGDLPAAKLKTKQALADVEVRVCACMVSVTYGLGYAATSRQDVV